MAPDDAEEYTQSLGQVMGGGYRQVLLGQKLGVPQALGLTVEEWVTQRLGGYVRMAVPDRREAVKELAADGLSQREIAEVIGIGPATVNRDLHVPNETTWRRLQDIPGVVTVPNETPEPPPLLSVVDLETGEIVATAEEYRAQREQEEAEAEALIAAVPDPNGTEDLWRLRHMVARGVSQFSSNVLVLDPEAAAAACDDGQRRDMAHFRTQVDRWISAFERATARGIRAVK